MTGVGIEPATSSTEVRWLYHTIADCIFFAPEIIYSIIMAPQSLLQKMEDKNEASAVNFI